MSIQLEAWHLISLAVSLAGANAAAIRWGRDREAKALDERFHAIERERARDAERHHKLERELLLLKAELPMSYVQRADYIRGQSVIESKLDSLAKKLESLQVNTAAFLNTQGGHLR